MARYLEQAIGGEARTYAYYDDAERHMVAVVEAVGAPHADLVTYSSASLHASPNELEGDDIRVELLFVAARGQESAANAVATSAFFVLKDGWLAAPGVVFPDAVREYFPGTTVPHLMWTEPFDFPDLSTFTAPDVPGDIHVLQGVPVSDAEREHLIAHGFDSLEHRLSAARVHHFDLQRRSVC